MNIPRLPKILKWTLGFAVGFGSATGSCTHAAGTDSEISSPSVFSDSFTTAKPWTRWWWPGSAVDKASLTRQLEEISAAGIGGVEITPIYGAYGYEDRYIDFLSARYMEMLEHVGREAKRLGLGVDMATGTGWPFGGPWITEADAIEKIAFKDGKLVGEPTHMVVKRAAPGDEGLVVNPFSPESLRVYLAPFSKAFASFPEGLIRSQFHDSFEYYDASWAPRFADVFEAMHGYSIQDHAAELMGVKDLDAESLARLKDDYRATLAQMHLSYLRQWVEWSHAHGFVVRNQSHGAPANLLDLYANADIPETETFGSTPFPIPGLRRDPSEVREDQDLPEPLVIRFASSAAHVMGHPLASSETCTWLRDHWKVSLAMTKPEIDRLFVNGINHIFYHGTVFSPQDVPWPGWLFYASTQFNPQNTWWKDFGALNEYVARVQKVLQSGKPDNEILIYWPVHDVWSHPDGLMELLGVHHRAWATDSPFGVLAADLMHRGYAFDFISDAQLREVRKDSAGLVTHGGNYRVLLVPKTQFLPVETLQQIVALAEAGGAVWLESMPHDVPGLGHLEARRAEFRKLSTRLETLANDGRHKVTVGPIDLADETTVAALAGMGVTREPVADTGIGSIRRKTESGYAYFLSNLTAKTLDGWVELGTRPETVAMVDPLTGNEGVAAIRRSATKTEIYLQLAPGESRILETSSSGPGTGKWTYLESGGDTFPINGKWTVEFISGGPKLPATTTMDGLESWTELEDPEAQRFGGTARYTIAFDAPAVRADAWVLDLGDVRESARVRLNGHDVTTAWSLPMRVRVDEFLQPGPNVLELEVTNLAANRIRDMDKRGVKWKIMREINFVNIRYQPFDASKWPLQPSGLLGPVELVPMKKLEPR